jgi:hypothetical protein
VAFVDKTENAVRCPMSALTEKQKDKVTAMLRKNRFTRIEWRGDMVSCCHRSHKSRKPKGITDLVRLLGFYVPCGGIAAKAYCQVWHPKWPTK